jgi:ABC-type Fe3+-siderophore transport system permease subunit
MTRTFITFNLILNFIRLQIKSKRSVNLKHFVHLQGFNFTIGRKLIGNVRGKTSRNLPQHYSVNIFISFQLLFIGEKDKSLILDDESAKVLGYDE